MSDIHELIERALAIRFSQNRQPHMSGDPRERLSALQRRNMEDARDAVIAALGIPVETLRGLRDGSLVAAPRAWVHPQNARELAAALGRLNGMMQSLMSIVGARWRDERYDD